MLAGQFRSQRVTNQASGRERPRKTGLGIEPWGYLALAIPNHGYRGMGLLVRKDYVWKDSSRDILRTR